MLMRFLILLLFFLGFPVFGQKMSHPEFEKLREKAEDLAASQPDSASFYANKILVLARNSKSESYLAKGLSTLAYVKVFQAKLDQASRINQQSLAINSRQNSEPEIAKNYYVFGMINLLSSNFTEAINNLLKSVELCKTTNLYSVLERNYQALSNIYFFEQDFEKSLNYGHMALDVQKKLPNTKRKAYDYLVIANSYRGMGKYDLAELNYNKSNLLFKKIKYVYGEMRMLLDRACSYNLQDDEIKALKDQLEAQKLLDGFFKKSPMAENNLAGIGTEYLIIAKNDSLLNAYQKNIGFRSKAALLADAEYYIKKSLSISKKSKNLEGISISTSNLSGIQYDNGEFKDAYLSLLQSKELSDSLYSQKNKNAIAKLESQKEIDLKNVIIQAERKQKWYFIIGLLLLGIIGILLFWQSKSRKKSNQKLQLLNTELDQANKTKARFFGILNHDLRSPVSNLIHFLHLQKENPELLDGKSKERLENKAIVSAENLLSSMEDILIWSKSQMESFKPEAQKFFVSSVFEETKNHFLSEEKIRFSFENPENLQLNTDGNYLKTIIRNLTGNAIKALKETKNPTIIWKAWQENNQSYLSISDNGSGATQEQFKALYDDKEVVGIKIGLGLHLIRDLAKAIDCEILVDTKINSGTTITLKLK